MTTKTAGRIKKELQEGVENVTNTVEKAAESLAENVKDTPIEMFFQHQRNAMVEMGKAVQSLIPEGVRTHGEAAIKEVVESYRTVLNAAIDELVKVIDRARMPIREAVEKADEKKETL